VCLADTVRQIDGFSEHQIVDVFEMIRPVSIVGTEKAELVGFYGFWRCVPEAYKFAIVHV
jgi:hypothetical protein